MAVNTIPERLQAFRVYNDGTNDLKGVADLQLPSFEPMKDTVKGAGIAGEYESPTLGHTQSMKLTLNWKTVSKDILQFIQQKSHRLDCRGAFQDYEAARGQHVVRSVRVVIQGPTMKVDPGKWETGATTGGSTEFEALYLKIDIDDVTYVEIDKLNYIFKVDGVDYLAATRAALGI